MSAVLLLTLACTGTTGSTGTTSDSGHEVYVEPPPEFPAYTGGDECPEITEGVNTGFESLDQNRRFEVFLPDEPEGAPLLFQWHPLGWTADDWAEYLDLEDFAKETGAIVVVPTSCCSVVEWMFLNPATDNEDLAFFDDALGCLYEQYAFDHKRIYSTGMSAGGLMTTYLTVHRSEWLAAAAPFSGGTEGLVTYSTPAEQIPVLITWGGANDVWQIYDFNAANVGYSAELQADGHFVAECDHGGGHTVQKSWFDWAWTWLDDHPKGIDSEPYADGLPSDFPDWCEIPG
jgi:poly(3-hydroxybutyrate) depolymerase